VQCSSNDKFFEKIDRLMEHCQDLREELARERAAYARLEEYCGCLVARQVAAANRLEDLFAAVLLAAPDLSAQEAQSIDLPEEPGKEGLQPPLQVKSQPVDWADTLERISCLAADKVEGPRSKSSALSAAEEKKSDERADTGTAEQRDEVVSDRQGRLF
jgi:hypothetical protein